MKEYKHPILGKKTEKKIHEHRKDALIVGITNWLAAIQ